MNKILLLLMLVCIIYGCPPPPPQPICPPVPAIPKTVGWNILSSTKNTSGTLDCDINEVEWGPEYQELTSLDPQGEVIYPGSVLEYNSFESGQYKPIVGDRKPLTISISLSNLSGNVSQEIKNPSLSSTREAIKELLVSKTLENGVAQINWKKYNVYSKEHFDLSIGGNYGSFFGSLSASFNFSNTEIISRFLLEFTQIYYSIDIDIPQEGVENYFENYENIELGEWSPVIISSVKYGRKVFILIESKTIDFNQGANLDASFSTFFGSGGLKVDQTLNKLISEKSIRGMIMGGPASSAIPVVLDVNNLKNFLNDGANFSDKNLGVPLSYNLRFLTDNSVAKLVLYDKFIIRDCQIIRPNSYLISLNDIVRKCPNPLSTSGDNEFDGNGPFIDAECRMDIKGNGRELWYYVKLHLKETKHNWTEAKGSWSGMIYKCGIDSTISTILSKPFQIMEEDRSTNLNIYKGTANDVHKRIEINGDTKGNDIGACTNDDSYISIFWNPIKFEVKKK